MLGNMEVSGELGVQGWGRELGSITARLGGALGTQLILASLEHWAEAHSMAVEIT